MVFTQRHRDTETQMTFYIQLCASEALCLCVKL